MAVHTEDMNKVADPDALPSEGWKRVRIASVKEDVSTSKGMPVVVLGLKVQDEGPELGRVIQDKPSLQSHALFKLKGYYKACGYHPGPEGHDPEKLIDCELYVLVTHGSYEGVATVNIPPWGLRALQDGPGKNYKSKPKVD
jgi:hypothetical protein